jgi:hypothetical protein
VSAKIIPSRCFSIDSFAEYVGVAPLTIRREIDRKKLKASHIGRRVAGRALRAKTR